MKLWVASMGSMIQRVVASPVLGAVLLADQPVIRVARPDPLADRALDALVRDRHERPVRLAREVEVAPEVAHRDRVRLVAGLEREREPRTQRRLGGAGERGGPVRPGVGRGHGAHDAGPRFTGATDQSQRPAPASMNEWSVG